MSLPCCCLHFTRSDKLLVHSHYRGALCAVYLCTRLCHCHCHSHVGFLLIFHSHIPICLFPPPPPNDPPSVVASFSRYSLPITSLLSHSSFRRCPSQRFSQTRNPGEDFLAQKHWQSRWPHVPLSLFNSQRGQFARQREAGKGGCISSRPTS